MTITQVFSSQTLQTTPSGVGLVQQVQILLDATLDLQVNGFDIIARDTQRRSGRYLDCIISYEEPAAVPLTDPFVFHMEQAKTAEAAAAAIDDWKALNPGWWFSATSVKFSDSVSGQVSDPYVAWVMGSADPNAGANWAAGGGGSSGELEIVVLNSETTITDFDKVYSLQGGVDYTVTLPEANAANLNKIFYFYKEGNSDLDAFITLQTVGQPIKANSTEYTSLQFRFTGELIGLISHGTHYDVISESSLFSNCIPVNDQTGFINGILKCNWLGGGVVQLNSQVTLTANRTVDLTGIRVFADGGEGTQLRIPAAYVLSIIGNGFYFDSVRFTGDRLDRATGASQHFMNITSNTVNAGKFEGCVFRNMVTRDLNADDGNISIFRSGTGSGYNITFTDCDIFTPGAGDADGIHFVNKAADTALGFMNIFCFLQKRLTQNFNLFRMTGNAIGPFGSPNGNGVTDGSVIFDTTVAVDRITSRTVTAQKPVISYQAEKTTIDGVDDLLIHDKASDTLRRISYSDLLAIIFGRPQYVTAGQAGAIVTLVNDATIAIDMEDGNNFEITLNGNHTLGNPATVQPGQSGLITVTQDATGTRLLSFGSVWAFSGSAAPVLSTAAGAVDVLAYYAINATTVVIGMSEQGVA